MVVAPLEEVLLIVSWPLAAPAVDGLKITFSVAVCPTLSVSGNVSPEMLNPVPVTVAEVTDTEAVPVEVRARDWVAALLMITFPNEIDVALRPSFDCAGESCSRNVPDAPPPIQSMSPSEKT